MTIKTISTVDGVNVVDFGNTINKYYWFRNLGDTTVYVSNKAEFKAGDDGVSELTAKGDITNIETLDGKVYILGAGKVEIHNTNSKLPPFKSAPVSSGGGGKVPEKIFYDNGVSADLNSATQSGCYAATPDTLNAPSSSWWLVDTMNYNNNQFIVQKAHALGNTEATVSYIRNYANDAWSDWTEMYTTGNKPYVTGSFSGTSFSNDNFDFKPSFAICNDNGTIKYGNIYQMSDVFRVLFENLSDTTHKYIIFK